jgi:hypothetical protein
VRILTGVRETRGLIRIIAIANPAAGAEVIQVVPAGKRWKLLSFNARLVTSAAVVTRHINFVCDDGAGNIGAASDSQVDHAASTGQAYLVLPTSASYQSNTRGPGGSLLSGISVLIPWAQAIEAKAGMRFTTLTGGPIDVADQWQNASIMVEEFTE